MFESIFDDIAIFAFAFAFFDVAARLDGGHDGGIGGRTADAELLELFNERTFGVAGGGFDESLASSEFYMLGGVANGEIRKLEVFGLAVDFEETVENDDFATGDKDTGSGFWVVGGEEDGGFGDLGAGHLGREGAGADEVVEFAFEVIASGGLDLDMSWADGFVGFLGAGGFGFKVASAKIAVAEVGFYVVCDAGESLGGEIKGVGTVVGDVASLVKTLGGTHGGRRGEAEAGVGLDLEGGGGKGDGSELVGLRAVDGGDGVGSVFKGFEESFSFVFGGGGVFFESGEEGGTVFRGERAGNFEIELFAKSGNLALFSTMRRRAGLWTRPAEMAPGTLRRTTPERSKPTSMSRVWRAC